MKKAIQKQIKGTSKTPASNEGGGFDKKKYMTGQDWLDKYEVARAGGEAAGRGATVQQTVLQAWNMEPLKTRDTDTGPTVNDAADATNTTTTNTTATVGPSSPIIQPPSPNRTPIPYYLAPESPPITRPMILDSVVFPHMVFSLGKVGVGRIDEAYGEMASREYMAKVWNAGVEEEIAKEVATGGGGGSPGPKGFSQFMSWPDPEEEEEEEEERSKWKKGSNGEGVKDATDSAKTAKGDETETSNKTPKVPQNDEQLQTSQTSSNAPLLSAPPPPPLSTSTPPSPPPSIPPPSTPPRPLSALSPNVNSASSKSTPWPKAKNLTQLIEHLSSSCPR